MGGVWRLSIFRWRGRQLSVAEFVTMQFLEPTAGRKCGTHSPTALRPGAISYRLRDDFAHQGYPLLTRAPASGGIIEDYPTQP
jgi:hypothetical protein